MWGLLLDKKDLLKHDWADEWDQLPEEVLPSGAADQASQITLRLPTGAATALQRLAQRKTLPYLALARSWIIHGIELGNFPDARLELIDAEVESGKQLNIKIDPAMLTRLKRFGHDARTPYHRLARLWIYEGLRREGALQEWADAVKPQHIPMKEFMLLLLHAPGPGGIPDEAIRGVTRLTKLLFVASQQLLAGPKDRFYAYDFGPFSDEVYDATQALEHDGLLSEEAVPNHATPTFEEMMTVIRRKSKTPQASVPVFSLSERGRQVAATLTNQRKDLEAVLQIIKVVKQDYGRLKDDELIERVYEEFPTFTTSSRIADKVLHRSKIRKDVIKK